MVARGWGEGRMGSHCLVGTEFQLCKMKKFWRWMMVMVALQCEGIECHPIVHLKKIFLREIMA